MNTEILNNTDRTESLHPFYFIRSKKRTCVFAGNYRIDIALIEAAQECARIFGGAVEVKTGNPLIEFPECEDDTENASLTPGSASCAFSQAVLPLVWVKA